MEALWVRLTEEELGWLSDVSEHPTPAPGKTKGEPTTPERWVFQHLRKLAADYNRSILRLHALGLELHIPPGPDRPTKIDRTITAAEVDIEPFKAPAEGEGLRVRFPNVMLVKLEEGAAIDDTVNATQGPPARRYKDLGEWLRDHVISDLVREKGDLDAKRFEDLEKQTFAEPESLKRP